ncbi:MAG: hypothetical protein AB1758_08515 [Candidatus Eremiobacterota bacterium]
MRGVTLVETLISIFLFSAALLISCNLFHAAMQYNRRADERQLAVRLAQNKLEEIVAWARGRSGSSYNYDDWSTYAGVTGTFPEAPQLNYRIEVEISPLADPCSSFQSVALPDRQRSIEARRVHVRVWQSGPAIELTTLVRPPIRDLAPTLTVQPVGGLPDPLPKDAPATFSVQAFDTGGVPVNGITYQWYLSPATGSGTLSQTWSGDQATLTNVVPVPLRPPIYTGGTCQLKVRARYGGRDYWGASGPINLEGP